MVSPILTADVLEGTSGTFTATLVDETGATVSSADLTTATLTLFDEATGTIINSRDGQDVLNAHDVTISTAGALSWAFTADDTLIINDARAEEVHRALWTFTWPTSKTCRAELLVRVQNLQRVP